MRRNNAAWRFVFAVECIVLMTPAALFLLMAGLMTFIALSPLRFSEPPEAKAAEAIEVWVMMAFGVPFLLGTAGWFEVLRLAVATFRERVVVLGARSTLSGIAGILGAVAGWHGLWVLGDRKANPDDLTIMVAVIVIPVVLLAAQIMWQQRKLARAEAWRGADADA